MASTLKVEVTLRSENASSVAAMTSIKKMHLYGLNDTALRHLSALVHVMSLSSNDDDVTIDVTLTEEEAF